MKDERKRSKERSALLALFTEAHRTRQECFVAEFHLLSRNVASPQPKSRQALGTTFRTITKTRKKHRGIPSFRAFVPSCFRDLSSRPRWRPVFNFHPSSFHFHPSSFILHPSAFILSTSRSPTWRVDNPPPPSGVVWPEANTSSTPPRIVPAA